MKYEKLLEKYSTLEKEIYNDIVNKMNKNLLYTIALTKDEEFDIDSTEDTVKTIDLVEFSNGAQVLNIIVVDSNDDNNSYSLCDDNCTLLDKLQILKILEDRHPINLVATDEDDLHEVFQGLSTEQKIERLSSLYTSDEILEVLGYGDGSMSDEDVSTLELNVEDSNEWIKAVYLLAMINGNFIESIAYDAVHPI